MEQPSAFYVINHTGPTSIYISGPMAGVNNYQARFQKAEDFLKEKFPAATIYNPCKLGMQDVKEVRRGEAKRNQYLRRDVSYIATKCDAIFLLDGWQDSLGAMLEHSVAQQLDLFVMYQSEYPGTSKFNTTYGKNSVANNSGTIVYRS